jgi:hypothetical protein
MDILQYLIALLKDNRQIGVEGLGTFIKLKKPGRYDADTHSFLPPSYVLDFTTNIQEHSNLVKYIQEKRGVSEDTAKYFIGQFVTQFQNDVAQEDQKIEGLGTFSFSNDELSFKADENFNAGSDFFALPPVNVANAESEVIVEHNTLPKQVIEQVETPDFQHVIAKSEPVADKADENAKNLPLAVEEEVKPIENEATDTEVFEEITEVDVNNPTNETQKIVEINEQQIVPSQEIIEERIQANEYQGTQEEIEEERRSSGVFWKISIVLLILLAIAATVYFLKPELFNVKQKADQTNISDSVLKRDGLITQADSLDFADSVMAEAHKVGLDVKPAKDTLKVTTTAKPLPPVTYDIIGAAFAKLSEADEYIAIMKNKGFDAKIAKMPGKIYKKISIASYDNVDSAEKYLKIYKTELKNSKIYIQTIKNN